MRAVPADGVRVLGQAELESGAACLGIAEYGLPYPLAREVLRVSLWAGVGVSEEYARRAEYGRVLEVGVGILEAVGKRARFHRVMEEAVRVGRGLRRKVRRVVAEVVRLGERLASPSFLQRAVVLMRVRQGVQLRMRIRG